jgi:general secretion pathway protein A
MSYYQLLGLSQEPFSSSPDPDFLFMSREHKAALCRLQVAIALKRGMSVVAGDVGTGKTTLSRKLAQVLGDDEDTVFRMILNPYFKSEDQFLARLANLFHIKNNAAGEMDPMEAMEWFLFRTGVEEEKTVVLLIDEAQMLPEFVLEILRILLNYETNKYKILQLVLVGQLELLPRIRRLPNFWDRVGLKCMLRPLGAEEAASLIDFRLRHAGYKGDGPLFSDEAVRLICGYTQGYPRKMSFFCHSCLEQLVMHDKKVVDAALVRYLIETDLRVMVAEGAASSNPEAGAQRA